MQKRFLLVLVLCSLVLLAGCGGKKTSMPVQFDNYTMQRYTDGKVYQQSNTPLASNLDVIYQATQQNTTGEFNSFLIGKVTVASGISVQDVTELNSQQIQQKLLNYKGTAPTSLDVNCDDIDLTGYSFSFSYDLDQDQSFSVYQYFFQTGDIIYMISLQSKDEKDIGVMEKSIKSIVCK